MIGVLAALAPGIGAAGPASRTLEGTVDVLLDLDVRPFAIGHRGSGANLDDRSRPIENTVPAVRSGFRAGLSVVEIDVQLTRDGEVAAFHEDFLPDLTCLNLLTLAELQARLPHVPTLHAVLNQARQFNEGSGPLRGLVIVELKPAAPLCDPHDTQEHAIVSAVSDVVRRREMTDQVLLTSFSPALLSIAAHEAPEIERILAVSGLQFLTAEQIQDRLRLPVTLIDKTINLGLQWAEVGLIFRLPGYRSIGELLSAAVGTGARVVEADLFLLQSAGAPLVEALHAFPFQLKVFGFTATTAAEWTFLQELGVDGIYTDDVELGITHQVPLP
jgi:glycerophosphoryl diester phosphodiesterase